MTLFALVVLTVVVTNQDTKQYEVRTKPVGLYSTMRGTGGCEQARESLQAGLPPDQEAVCLRASR